MTPMPLEQTPRRRGHRRLLLRERQRHGPKILERAVDLALGLHGKHRNVVPNAEKHQVLRRIHGEPRQHAIAHERLPLAHGHHDRRRIPEPRPQPRLVIAPLRHAIERVVGERDHRGLPSHYTASAARNASTA